MSPEDHDQAVAVTSHLPQLVSYALAAQAAPPGADRGQRQLVGQGLRDMTRIAHSDPELWVEIASGNRRWLREALEAFDARIHQMIAAIRSPAEQPADDQLRGLFEEGVAGASRMPGKHGGTERPVVAVSVEIPDAPGQLAALFVAAGEAGINIEDVHIAHAPTAPAATVELFVTPEAGEELRRVLRATRWPTAI